MKQDVKFEVLTAVTMDVTPCVLVDVSDCTAFIFIN
jgi:hypothetical protein